MKTVSAAIVAACLLVGSAGVAAEPVENVAAHVSTAGVKFNDPASVDKFRARVKREIAAVCNPGDRLNADMTPDFACRKSMAVTAETRIALMQAQSNSMMAIVE